MPARPGSLDPRRARCNRAFISPAITPTPSSRPRSRQPHAAASPRRGSFWPRTPRLTFRDGLDLLGPFPQHELLNLAGGGLRQWTEDDGAGHLEMCKVVTAPGDDFVRRDVGRVGLQRHKRTR